MFHMRCNICLGSKISILKETFAHGHVIHIEEWSKRERFNSNSPWHGLGESGAIVCQTGRKKYMKSTEKNKEDNGQWQSLSQQGVHCGDI